MQARPGSIMSFSEARSVPLVLFLTSLHFSDVRSSSTAATSVTLQNVDQQTPEHLSNNTGLQTDRITSGPPTTTIKSVVQTEEITNLIKDNITIIGSTQGLMTKNITLVSPTELELLCSLPVSSSTEMEKIDVAWKMGNKTVKEESIHRNETKTKWCTQYTVYVRNKDQMGNYTCIFKTEQEVNATFHLKVPEIHIKSEVMITYVGYSVILSCSVGNETVRYKPSFWAWYKMNGSEKVTFNSTVMPKKYEIIEEHASITKLKILDLSEDDGGFYCCEVGFPPGESKGQVSLKVLTFMAPLKPFLAIAAEVIILVAIIFIFEVCSKRKDAQAEAEKEFEQIETLKSEDSNGVESSTTRHRKV